MLLRDCLLESTRLFERENKKIEKNEREKTTLFFELKDLLRKGKPWWGGKGINLCCSHNAPYAIFGQHEERGYRPLHTGANEAKKRTTWKTNMEAFVDWFGVLL